MLKSSTKRYNHIILEGVDGIGKNTVMQELWPLFNGQRHVYCRGDISNYVYAKKYHRKFYMIQNNLPFLYIILIGDKSRIIKQIKQRLYDNNKKEIDKVNDQDLFVDAYYALLPYYNIELFDVQRYDAKTIAKMIYNIIEKKEKN